MGVGGGLAQANRIKHAVLVNSIDDFGTRSIVLNSKIFNTKA